MEIIFFPKLANAWKLGMFLQYVKFSVTVFHYKICLSSWFYKILGVQYIIINKENRTYNMLYHFHSRCSNYQFLQSSRKCTLPTTNEELNLNTNQQ